MIFSGYKLMDQAVLILSDWATKVKFEEKGIEKEKKIVHEEWRLGQATIYKQIAWNSLAIICYLACK
jgi:predicted Zn-dependent peptidase